MKKTPFDHCLHLVTGREKPSVFAKRLDGMRWGSPRRILCYRVLLRKVELVAGALVAVADGASAGIVKLWFFVAGDVVTVVKYNATKNETTKSFFKDH
jgi:hypothetical protein